MRFFRRSHATPPSRGNARIDVIRFPPLCQSGHARTVNAVRLNGR